MPNLSTASLAPARSRAAKCTAFFPPVYIIESRTSVWWAFIVTGDGYLPTLLQKTLCVQWAGKWVCIPGVSFVIVVGS